MYRLTAPINVTTAIGGQTTHTPICWTSVVAANSPGTDQSTLRSSRATSFPSTPLTRRRSPEHLKYPDLSRSATIRFARRKRIPPIREMRLASSLLIRMMGLSVIACARVISCTYAKQGLPSHRRAAWYPSREATIISQELGFYLG